MPNWKKVVVSGSDAALSSLNVTGNVTAATLSGNGSGVTNVTAASVAYANVTGKPTLFSGSSQVDHDSTTNYVANKHIDHTTVSITAGSGLTGGGDISTNRTINVGAGLGMTVNADDIAVNTGSTHFTNGVKSKLNTDVVHSGSYLGTATTSNLGEGTNLYYTDTRVKTKLNADSVLSGSVSSPSQGTISVGGFTNIDLGVQSGDSPTFASVTATNFTGTASRATVGEKVDVISGGSTTGLGIYSGSFSGSFIGLNQTSGTVTSVVAGDGLSGGTITSTGTISLNTSSAHFTNGVSGVGTTVGNSFFKLTNPSAITFPRINANNTVSALSAADFLTAIGAYASSNPSGYTTNTGTVTSVSGTGTVSGLTLSGTVTTTGNITLGGTLSVAASNFASQTANTVLAAPNGSNGAPTFRSLVAADIPSLSYLPSSGGTLTGDVNWGATGRGITWAFNTDGASIKFYNTGDGDTDSRLEFNTTDNNNEYFRWTHTPSGGSLYESMKLVPTSANNATLTVNGTVVATTFTGALNGNANTATSAATWTTARTLTIGSTGKSVNGSANVSWTLAEIGAAAASHTHAISEVTGLQTALDGKAASSHTHAISDVTGLQTALDGKLATAGGTITGALTVNGVITLGIAGATSVISSTTSYGDGTTLIMRGPSAGSFQLQPNSTKAGIFLSSSGNVGIDTVQPKYKLDVSNNTVQLGRVYREFQEYTGASANKLVRTWDGVLVAGSDDGSAETYTIIDTGVPQDSYMMGGFTIEWFENYSSTNAKTQIKIAGYWNPEGNSGFIGFEYTTSNPYIRPTIQVARNSSTGNTAFILSHFNASYPIIVARDLWLGYSTGADTYGTGWTIKQAANTTGYTNFDTVVARGAAPIDQTMHVGTTAIAINRGSGAQTLTGVSIDGNAATAGALTSMNISQFTNNSGYITGLSFDGLSSKTGGTGTYQTSGDFRAPIFYDSNDTGYYTDPNGISRVWGIAIRGDNSSTGTENQIFFWGAGNSTTSAIGFKANGGYFGNPTGNGDGYNTYFTMDSDGRGWVFRRGVGGADFGAAYTAGWILNNGIAQFNASTRSPIFYDSNDTTYYIDPNTTATSINVRGEIKNPSVWINDGDNYNDYNENIRLFNAPNGVSVIALSATGVNGMPGSSILGYSGYMERRIGNSWQDRIYDGYAIAAGSYRAPIFYDSDNTAYYVDPNSTTSAVLRGWTNFADYGAGIVGSYSSYRYQLVFAMGDSYKGTIDGTSVAGGYGLWYSHPNAGGVASNLSSHGLMNIVNGTFYASLDASMRAVTDMRTPIFYDLNDTGYYVDPNGTARLSTIYCGNVYNDLGGWFRNYGATGIYNQSYGNHFYAESYTYWVLNSSNGMVIKDAYAGTSKGYLYYDGSGFGLLHSNGGWAVRTTTSLVEIYNRLDAPIVYDSNNTGYYTDPASTSNINAIQIAGKINQTGPGRTSTISLSNYDTKIGSDDLYFYFKSIDGGQYPGALQFMRVSDAATSWPLVLMPLGGNVGIGSYSGDYKLDVRGIIYSNTDVRTPIFYDANNTGYYTDPASTSVMNQINLTYLYGNVEAAASNNSSTSYSVAAIELRESQYGGSSSYLSPRLAFHWGGVVASQISVESSGRISIIDNPGSSYESLIGSILYGNSSVRGPIFYDTNNTGYYVDPNSTGDSIRCAGDIVAFYSDERLKDIEHNIPNAIEKVKTLNGFYYTPNELAQKLGYQNKREVGLSAQQVEKILPEIIKEAPIDSRYKTMDYSKLVPLLVEAIKEQQTKIEELELFINNLKH